MGILIAYERRISMPGFVTHYLFGRDMYHKLKNAPLRSNLYHNRGAYGLGLQGPDIFFYYLPSYVLHGNNIGALAHIEETNAFFHGLILSHDLLTNETDRQIAEAYLLGFLGHYMLDTTCHPYIYAMSHYKGRTNEYYSKHAYLETDIDTALLKKKLHRQPRDFKIFHTFALTARQKKVIANLLYDAYHYAFPELPVSRATMHLGIFSIHLGTRMLRDTTGQKKALFRFLEKHLLGYPIFSPLIPSNTRVFRSDPFNLRHASWSNPWDEQHTSTESFYDLYQKAGKRYLALSHQLYTLLQTDKMDKSRSALLYAFLQKYDNLSFHSGLDVSIPS